MPTQENDPTSTSPAASATGVTDADLLDAVRDWLPDRRWFPAKGSATELSVAGGRTLTDPRGEAEVRVLLVRARSATVDTVLQVPLTLHPAEVASLGRCRRHRRRPARRGPTGSARSGTAGDCATAPATRRSSARGSTPRRAPIAPRPSSAWTPNAPA